MSSSFITNDKIDFIKRIIRCFETDSIEQPNYGAIAILPDGPNSTKQITYGESQTTEFGNLSVLIRMYYDAKGKYSQRFANYLGRIGKPGSVSLHTDKNFMQLLRDASTDPIMHETQEKFFVRYYFHPALSFFDLLGLTLPFSLLVVYDSYVHSGGVPTWLRDDFKEVPPSNGGDEKKWINAYVNSRDYWLENHSKKLLQATDYRTDSFIYNERHGNWMLDKDFIVVNYPDREELGKPVFKNKVPAKRVAAPTLVKPSSK